MNPDEFVQYIRDIIPKVKSIECRYSMASNAVFYLDRSTIFPENLPGDVVLAYDLLGVELIFPLPYLLYLSMKDSYAIPYRFRSKIDRITYFVSKKKSSLFYYAVHCRNNPIFDKFFTELFEDSADNPYFGSNCTIAGRSVRNNVVQCEQKGIHSFSHNVN